MTRELRENIEVKCDTIAGVLNVMGEEGRLIRQTEGAVEPCHRGEEVSESIAKKSLQKPLPVL